MLNINASLKWLLRSNTSAKKTRAGRVFIVTVAVFLGSISVAQAVIPAHERAVLANLYAYTDGAHWASQEGWNGPPGTECSWFGITCNSAGTSVIGIDLTGNGLYGFLPLLNGLTNLESLDVSQTPVTNALVPPGSSNYAGRPIEFNKLYGALPPLNVLTKLQTFKASQAYFSGGIPSLAGMSDLQHFECTYCAFNGSIGSLAGLTHLNYFKATSDLELGALSGSIPALSGLSDLEHFEVEGNFTGKLPDLSGLSQLQTFGVEGYRFTGGTPNLIDLPKLQSFFVGGFVAGPIGALSNLPDLQMFAAGGLLTGSIPPLAQLPALQRFNVSHSKLTGSVPDLSTLGNLQYFDVSYNQLSGSLPEAPQSLIDKANATGYFSALVCPNLLTPASSPPSPIDAGWNAITNTTPWSQGCTPNPLWKPDLYLGSSANPSMAGETVTFTAVVYGEDPTGTVTFKERSTQPGNTTILTLCDSVPVIDDVASCTTSDLVNDGSTQEIFANYSGDANNAFVDISPNTGIAQQVRDVVAETSSAGLAHVGQPVDLMLTYRDGHAGDKANFYDSQVGDKALCSNVPVFTSRAGHFVAHCMTQFSTPGAHVLTATAGFIVADPMIQTVVAATPFDANQFELTGPWYNPATSGQGLQFAVYRDHAGSGVGTLIGGWFTYDASGNQRWMALQGDLSASHGDTYNLQVGQGNDGNFNTAPITAATAIGSAKLTFYDCGNAVLTYKLDDGRSGTVPYARLDNPSGCSGNVPARPSDTPSRYRNDVQHGGAWYNPATSGQGVFLDLVPAQTSFFATWYTYALQGNTADTGVARQRWFTLQDNDYTPGDLNLHDVKIIASSGGVFNQPSAIDTQQVGNAHITFNSCTSMTLTYSFDKGEFSGQSGTIDEQVLAPNPGCQP